MMIVKEISGNEYKKRLMNVSYGYMKLEFCEYNREKVEDVIYLLFLDEKKERFVAALGKSDNMLLLPFSAPFSVIGEISKNTELSHYREALYALKEYTESNHISKLRITFPPFFYQEKQISYWINAALMVGGRIKTTDLNYAIDLKKAKMRGYFVMLKHNAKKNLHASIEMGNEFYVCETEDDIRTSYEVIKKNREFKGYPLRMTYEQVRWTKDLLDGQCFLVKNKEKILAAAVVFVPMTKIAQVIYWGDMPGMTEYRAVNFLASSLVDYYLERDFDVLDIGPSTENGVPNEGLCRFKDSIGCEVSLKITVEL